MQISCVGFARRIASNIDVVSIKMSISIHHLSIGLTIYMLYLQLLPRDLLSGKADVAAVASISTKTFSAMKTQAGKSRMGKREKIHAMGREDLVDLILITKNLDEFRIR